MLRINSDDLRNNLKRLICNGEAIFFSMTFGVNV